MFGIGTTELLIILVIALIVFGPKRLPELAKQLGKAFRELRKATDEVKENIGLNELDIDSLTATEDTKEPSPSASPEEESDKAVTENPPGEHPATDREPDGESDSEETKHQPAAAELPEKNTEPGKQPKPTPPQNPSS